MSALLRFRGKHPPVGETAAERVLRLSIPEPNTGCWIWMGAVQSRNYGHVTIDRRQLLAHRASYEAFRGPIPKGLHVDHLCRNTLCVNPQHLEPVTCRENVRRGAIGPILKTHCLRGHPLSGANLIPNPDGRRACRTCNYHFQSKRNHLLCPKCGHDARWPSKGHTTVVCVECGHSWDQTIPEKPLPTPLEEASR